MSPAPEPTHQPSLRLRALTAPELPTRLLELTDLLHRAYARLGAMGLNYTAVDQPPEVTAQRIQGGHCLVAELGRAIVGTLVVRPTAQGGDCAHYQRAGVAALVQFAVEPGLQGQGVGRALLAAAEAWALAQGYRELAMDTAEPATHLLAQYQRWGYRPVGQVQWPGKRYRSVVLSRPLAAALG